MTLSSCYFCGTAIEQPLSEYPVVPDALGPAPDDQQTVVLCPACHRKLSTITDRIVAAVDDRQRTLDEASAGGSVGGEADTGGSAGGEADAGGSDSDGRPSIDESAAESLLEMGTSRSGPDGRSSPDDDSDGIVVNDSSPAAGDESDPATGTDEPSAGPVDGGGASDARAGDIGEDGPPQATYNRVVRLLQNREFPVERDEIATVAMNAYEIPPEDFDAVIETAVDRGLLEEDGGYLQRAD